MLASGRRNRFGTSHAHAAGVATSVGLILALSAIFVGLTPAAADYAPYIVADTTSGPPGTPVTFGNDPSGFCRSWSNGGPTPTDGVVEWAFGTIVGNPDIGGVVELDEVLISGTVATPQGTWSVTVTVPDATPPGSYALTGRCQVPSATTTTTSTTTETTATPDAAATATATAPRSTLFDYYPARFTVTGGQVASPTTTTSAPTADPPTAPPAPAVAGTVSFTG